MNSTDRFPVYAATRGSRPLIPVSTAVSLIAASPLAIATESPS